MLASLDALLNAAPGSLALLSAIVAAVAAVVAALVAAAVAGVGHWVSLKTSRESIKQAQRALAIELESIRQLHSSEVLRKRAETYPEFYRILCDYGRSWELRGKPRDAEWVGAFLEELLTNNAKNGVFFGRKLYARYGDLRDYLVALRARLRAGETIADDEINRDLYSIIRSVKGRPGVGSLLTDGVGGHVDLILSIETESSTSTSDAARDA